jgi:hypothetical protein
LEFDIPQGEKGDRGEKGEKGDRGEKGEKGDPGQGGGGGSWGTITGTLADQQDLQDELDGKADLVDGKVASEQLPAMDYAPSSHLTDENAHSGLFSAVDVRIDSIEAVIPDSATAQDKLVTASQMGDAIPVIPPIPTDLSDLSDATGILAGKVDKDGDKVLSDNNYTDAEKAKVAAALTSVPDASTSDKGIIEIATGAEVTAGTDTSRAVVPATLKTELDKKVDKVAGKGLSTNDYTTNEKNKVGKIELETLAELTGANVTIAPWTQSKWSASGVCSLTASGWAASGHQIAYIVITLAAEATLSISGTEEVAEDDALIAAGVYECYIKNVDGKKYFRVISFTEAAS